MRSPSSFARIAVAALLCLQTHFAFAQSGAPGAPAASGDARVHFDRGVALLNVQNFEGALAEFERSYAISPRPSILLNMGVALQSLHRYAESVRMMERYLREAPNLAPARRTEIQNGIDQMRSLLARLRLEVNPAGATVRIDGISVGTAPLTEPVEVGPGRHVIELEVGGRIVGRQDLTIASGEERSASIAAEQNPIAPRSGTSAAPSEPTTPRATLGVRGLPNGAVLGIDGRTVDPSRPVSIDPGTHAVEITAQGFATYRGNVSVAANETRYLTAHLARERRGLAPTIFIAGAAATAVTGIASIITGALTLSTRSAFLATYRDDPLAAELAARGNALRTATNVLLVATGVLAVGTVVVATQTRFGRAESSVGVSVAAAPDAAAATVTVRF